MSNEFGYRQLQRRSAFDRAVDDFKTSRWRFIEDGGGHVLSVNMSVALAGSAWWLLS